MSTIFSKIISGEIPCYKIAENEDFFSFLDIRPLAKGHCLVIPKKETDYIMDIDDQSYVELFLFAKKIAQAIKQAIPCKKVGVCVIGLEVAHAHIHLVPLNAISDMNFSNPKLEIAQEEMIKIANSIKAHILT